MTELEIKQARYLEMSRKYNSLCCSDKMLTFKEWQNLEDEKAKIKVELNQLEYELKNSSGIPDTGIKKPMTIKEVADYFQVTRQYVTRLREQGILKAYKIGKKYMFPADEIKRFERENLGKDINKVMKSKVLEGG